MCMQRFWEQWRRWCVGCSGSRRGCHSCNGDSVLRGVLRVLWRWVCVQWGTRMHYRKVLGTRCSLRGIGWSFCCRFVCLWSALCGAPPACYLSTLLPNLASTCVNAPAVEDKMECSLQPACNWRYYYCSLPTSLVCRFKNSYPSLIKWLTGYVLLTNIVASWLISQNHKVKDHFNVGEWFLGYERPNLF